MKLVNRIALFMMVYGLLCLFLFLRTGNYLFLMLIWNVFLASLPLIFMKRAVIASSRWKIAGYLLLWILFFPNAIYMITDFIHLTNDQMIWSVQVEPYSGMSSTRYSMKLLQWNKLLVISLGAFYALLIGLDSLNVFYDHLREKKGQWISLVVVILISCLASFGVFIGRFLRFNSWDLLRPGALMKETLSSLDSFAGGFTLYYSLFVLITLFLFRWFKESTH